jgi:hypothetical protein
MGFATPGWAAASRGAVEDEVAKRPVHEVLHGDAHRQGRMVEVGAPGFIVGPSSTGRIVRVKARPASIDIGAASGRP